MTAEQMLLKYHDDCVKDGGQLCVFIKGQHLTFMFNTTNTPPASPMTLQLLYYT